MGEDEKKKTYAILFMDLNFRKELYIWQGNFNLF